MILNPSIYNEEEKRVNYYFKLELLWIITNIHASLNTDTDLLSLQSLWFDCVNCNDLTATQVPSPIFDLLVNMFLDKAEIGSSLEC